MALKIGVVCGNCGEAIEIEDDYVPGISSAEITASFYQRGTGAPDLVNREWRKALTCRNPDCRQSREYTGGDLRLYDA